MERLGGHWGVWSSEAASISGGSRSVDREVRVCGEKQAGICRPPGILIPFLASDLRPSLICILVRLRLLVELGSLLIIRLTLDIGLECVGLQHPSHDFIEVVDPGIRRNERTSEIDFLPLRVRKDSQSIRRLSCNHDPSCRYTRPKPGAVVVGDGVLGDRVASPFARAADQFHTQGKSQKSNARLDTVSSARYFSSWR